MSGPYNPNPVHEVQDMHENWEFFEHFFGFPVVYETPVLFTIGSYQFRLTKFMILELIAAALILLIYVPLARRIRNGDLPRGRWWNFFEVLLVFIRDNVARPSLGAGQAAHADHHDDHAHGKESHGHGHHEEPLLGGHPADAFVPFLWTMFLFILFCNLLGMFPMMGSPTASIWVTLGLAIISFVTIHLSVILRHGVGGFFRALWPSIDMPPGLVYKIMGFFITLMLAVIEFVGLVIKSFVLAVRLFANMFAGHLVLANILLFIYVVGKYFGPSFAWGGITIASVLGVVALSLLELFVAFLQAYVFTFLTALFMGMQMSHAEHH